MSQNVSKISRGVVQYLGKNIESALRMDVSPCAKQRLHTSIATVVGGVHQCGEGHPVHRLDIGACVDQSGKTAGNLW